MIENKNQNDDWQSKQNTIDSIGATPQFDNKYSVFPRTPNNALLEPMFLGQPVNVARYDQQRYEVFEKLIEKQISFFWRPEEIDVSKDRIDYAGLPENEKHIFISNLKYQCLVEGTEVLTHKGWIDLTQYDGKSEILIYYLETGTTKWEVPEYKFTKQHKGDVYKFSSNVEEQFIQIVTPEHRMPYVARKSYKKYFVQAKDMQYKNTTMAPINGTLIDNRKKRKELTAIERLIIATQADGYLKDVYNGKLCGHIPIYFTISKKRKIARLKQLAEEANLELVFLNDRIYKKENQKPAKLFKLLVPIEYNPQNWKSLTLNFSLKNKNLDWAKDFCDECINWDGSRYEGNTASYYVSTDKNNADFVQAVATLAGYSPRMTTRKDNRKNKKGEQFKDTYKIRFIDKKFKNGESINKEKLQYDGLVSCVTVSTGAFVTRYKNCVTISGNCLLDSVQGRSPNVGFLPVVSLPELETWIESWAFFESIHSRSYTHIIRNIVNNPGLIFDDIVVNEEILKRAEAISCYYDDLISYTNYYNMLGEGTHVVNGKEIVIDKRELKKKIYLCLICVNVLEAIRFYVSFA